MVFVHCSHMYDSLLPFVDMFFLHVRANYEDSKQKLKRMVNDQDRQFIFR